MLTFLILHQFWLTLIMIDLCINPRDSYPQINDTLIRDICDIHFNLICVHLKWYILLYILIC